MSAFEDAADEASEHIKRVEEFQKENNKERYAAGLFVFASGSIGLFFPRADEVEFDGELDEEDGWEEDLQEVSEEDGGAAEQDVAVVVGGCFACPAHPLAEQVAKRCEGTDDGFVFGCVGNGDGQAAAFETLKEEHVIAGGQFGVDVGKTLKPAVTSDKEVGTGTHHRMPVLCR